MLLPGTSLYHVSRKNGTFFFSSRFLTLNFLLHFFPVRNGPTRGSSTDCLDRRRQTGLGLRLVFVFFMRVYDLLQLPYEIRIQVLYRFRFVSFFPWGILPLQSDWSMSSDHGLDYASNV